MWHFSNLSPLQSGEEGHLKQAPQKEGTRSMKQRLKGLEDEPSASETEMNNLRMLEGGVPGPQVSSRRLRGQVLGRAAGPVETTALITKSATGLPAPLPLVAFQSPGVTCCKKPTVGSGQCADGSRQRAGGSQQQCLALKVSMLLPGPQEPESPPQSPLFTPFSHSSFGESHDKMAEKPAFPKH